MGNISELIHRSIQITCTFNFNLKHLTNIFLHKEYKNTHALTLFCMASPRLNRCHWAGNISLSSCFKAALGKAIHGLQR